MTTSLTLLPASISASAQVSFTFDVAKNTSESGVSGRKAMRPVIRNYMATVSPEDSDEMQAIIMATLGARYPFALCDYSNRKITNEIQQHSGTIVSLGKTWEPATGTLSIYERILVPDLTEPFTVNVNGSPTLYYSFEDFGKIDVADLTDEDTVEVTCNFLTPVCMVDTPSATMYANQNGVTLYQFSDMHFEQIFEKELITLTSS
jgi:hypothetical protein